jgi:phosphatidylserine decarboxylase
MDRPSSTKKKYNQTCNPKQEFHSFNDFFTSKIKNNARPVDTTATISVAKPMEKLAPCRY